MATAYRPPSAGDSGEDQEIVACGRNDTGQLGVGDDAKHSNLLQVPFAALNRHRVLLLATGTHHTLVLTNNEASPLYGWGWGKYGQLGKHCQFGWSPTPILVTSQLEGSSIVDVGAGYSHSAFVTSSGKLFTTGRNDMGQLGLGHLKDTFEFTQVKNLQTVLKVSLGEYFCLALEKNDSTGVERILSFGSNEFGQLGLGDFRDRSSPIPVDLPELEKGHSVHLLRTGPFHCVVSLTNNHIFSWGRGDCGQTGLTFRQQVTTPTPMHRLMELVGDQPLRLLAVRAHNIAVTAHSGEILVWGRNNNAQLGLTTALHAPDGTPQLDPFGGSDVEDHSEPQVNSLLPTHGVIGSEITEIAVGPFHTSVIMNDSRLMTWGAISEQGVPRTSASSDTEVTTHIPHPLSLLRGRVITHLGAGYYHLVFVLDPPLQLSTSTLANDIGLGLDDPAFSDITLHVQDRVILTHRFILSARSRFFRAMFASGMIESTQRDVHIREGQYDAFYGLVLYLYTDCFYRGAPTPKTAQLALDILPLAELYDLPRLIQLCETTIIESNTISLDTVLDLYELCNRLNAKILKSRCRWFIIKHLELLCKSESWIRFPAELKAHFRVVDADPSSNVLQVTHSMNVDPKNADEMVGDAL